MVEYDVNNGTIGYGRGVSPKSNFSPNSRNTNSRISLHLDSDGKVHPDPVVRDLTLRDLTPNDSFHRTDFADHERLGPMELLKAEVNELNDLSFIDGMKDENGFTTYTGYLNA